MQGYDVIIIGSGPSGLIWAHEAINSNLKVLMIDQQTLAADEYSATGEPWQQVGNIVLGGVGGTANAWQGQSILLDEIQFQKIFDGAIWWNFDKYIKISNEIANILRIRLDIRSDKIINQIKSKLFLPKNVNIKFSFMPLELSWKKIFKSVVTSKNITFEDRRLESLVSYSEIITSLNFADGSTLEVNDQVTIVLAANAINNVRILKQSEENGRIRFPNIGQQIYDHPWRTKLQFQTRTNSFAKLPVFRYVYRLNFKMRLKTKFEVLKGCESIGVFEIRPVYLGSIFYKSIIKLSLILFRRSVLFPKKIEVWCQIAQVVQGENGFPIEKKAISSTQNLLSNEDLSRLLEVENTAKIMLLNSGFNEIVSEDLISVSQAFHPSGTILLGNDPNLQSFNFEGKSNRYGNLYLAGSAGLKNCSWINPTLTILIVSLGNARLALSKL
jgi:hypothetical protein